MTIVELILILYSCFLLIGAFFGWSAGSKISLIMGIVSAFLVFLGIYLISISELVGYSFLITISGILVIVFFKRLLTTRKFVPAGMLLGATIFILLLCIYQVIDIPK